MKTPPGGDFVQDFVLVCRGRGDTVADIKTHADFFRYTETGTGVFFAGELMRIQRYQAAGGISSTSSDDVRRITEDSAPCLRAWARSADGRRLMLPGLSSFAGLLLAVLWCYGLSRSVVLPDMQFSFHLVLITILSSFQY